MIDEDQSYPTCAVLCSTLRSALLAAGLLVVLGGCAVTADLDGVAIEAARVNENGPDARSVETEPKLPAPTSYVVYGKRYQVKANGAGHVERGLASWYGPRFHGRRTSSGERFDMNAMTAAHKTLPLATYAEVVNLENGRSTVVKINDRGPFKHGRVVDLSYAAAKQLGVIQPGVAMVELRAIDPVRQSAGVSDPVVAATGAPTKDPTAGSAAVGGEPKVASASEGAQVALADSAPASGAGGEIYLQVGAFGDRLNAEELRARLVRQLAQGVHVRTADGGRAPLYQVHVGPLPSAQRAKGVSQQLASLGLTDPQVVRE